jgi:hypothetical protein
MIDETLSNASSPLRFFYPQMMDKTQFERMPIMTFGAFIVLTINVSECFALIFGDKNESILIRKNFLKIRLASILRECFRRFKKFRRRLRMQVLNL